MAEELRISGRNELVRSCSDATPQKIRQQNNTDIGANVASGSYPTDAMIVLPCSVGTLARIANGMAIQLIERAADVCLKERRPLILCVRETPFNLIHLRNMTLAAEAGATIFPVIPAFYFQPAQPTKSRDAIACSRTSVCRSRRLPVENAVACSSRGCSQPFLPRVRGRAIRGRPTSCCEFPARTEIPTGV